MNNLNYQTYLADPDAAAVIERAARNARAEAIRKFIVVPMVRLCGSLLRMSTVTGSRLQPR